EIDKPGICACGPIHERLRATMTEAEPTASASAPAISTAALITAMVDSGKGISDLVFSPGRPPQVEKMGELTPVAVDELPMLRPEDTSRSAADLISGNTQALQTLKQQGACDLSYSLPDRCRFRVNIFRQRGTFAIVMRVIAQKIPNLKELGLPEVLQETAHLK